MDYEDAKKITDHIQKYISGLYLSGSMRRKEPIVNDIDFITKRPLDNIITDFIYSGYNFKVIINGEEYKQIKFINVISDIVIDIWRARDNYEYKFLKWMRDMDKGHNIFYRKLAKAKGLILSDRGLKLDDKYIGFNTKKDLINLLIK